MRIGGFHGIAGAHGSNAVRQERDQLIRRALGSGTGPAEILPHTSLTRARLYQIRNAAH